MEELIKINSDAMTVSARELHEKLNIGTEFAKWFTRMCEYGFSEGNEFKPVIVKNGENLKGGRPATDYDISIDMAKQICMIQRTPEGKTIRQYFIDLEKAWNTPEQIFARALKLADQTIADLKVQCDFLSGQIEEQSVLIEEMQPKVSYYDTILQSNSLITTTEIAKDYGMSAKKLNNLLNELRVQYFDKRISRWFLYANISGCGYAQSKTIPFKKTNGEVTSKTHMYWTQKGRLYLYDLLKTHGYLPEIEK